MNTNEIDDLLGKFYEGNTSLEEEKILRFYFQGSNIPAHLKEQQKLFNYYLDEQRLEFNDRDFNQKMTAQLLSEAFEPAVVPLHPTRQKYIFAFSIAAGVLLLIGLVFTFRADVFNGRLNRSGNPGTQIAYADVSEALMMVSGNLNNGLRQVERLQMVDKALKNVELFNKFYQYQIIIINPDEISDKSIKSK